MFPTKNFQLLEVLTAGTTILKHPLPVDQVLEGAKKIKGIEAYKVGEVTNSPISGNALANDTVFDKSFLVLVNKQNDEIISRIPLASLNKVANAGHLAEFDIDQINITKSFVQVAVTGGLVAAEVWMLGFHYEK